MNENQNPLTEHEIIQQTAKMKGKSEEAVREEIEKLWSKIREIEDPTTHDFWMLIDQPWRHPTAEEMITHVSYAYWLYELLVQEGIKVTGRTWMKPRSLNQVFDMLVGLKKPDKVVRGAMRAALYIHNEEDGANEKGRAD